MGQITQKDLDELLKANIIDEATATKISNYFELQKSGSTGRLHIVLAILGSLLAGLGIILFVAHNWDNLNRIVKTGLSFLPLLIGQSLCAYVLLKKRGIAAWRESSAAILLFAVGASISLISQVYHIEGSMSSFLLTWIILVTPLVYIMQSSTVALLVIAGISWYACLVGYSDFSKQIPYAYLAAILVLAPHYYNYFRKNPGSNFFHLLNWTGVVSLSIVLGCFGSTVNNSYGSLFLAYLCMFCLFYLYGNTPRWHKQSNWTNPFRIVGLLGVLIILFLWSFDFIWEDVLQISKQTLFTNNNLFLAVIFIVANLLVFFRNKEQRTLTNTDLTGLSFVPFTALLFLPPSWINLALLVINIWILLVAIYFIDRGTSVNHLGILNFGLLLVLILALCRFFDDRIPFVWRGIFFLATGFAFFAANYLLLRKRKKTIPQKL
jgi:uncharacterized membrane protein